MEQVENLLKKINALLDQFMQEELGNRLSQFSMMALKITIDEIIKEVTKDWKLVKE